MTSDNTIPAPTMTAPAGADARIGLFRDNVQQTRLSGLVGRGKTGTLLLGYAANPVYRLEAVDSSKASSLTLEDVTADVTTEETRSETGPVTAGGTSTAALASAAVKRPVSEQEARRRYRGTKRQQERYWRMLRRPMDATGRAATLHRLADVHTEAAFYLGHLYTFTHIGEAAEHAALLTAESHLLRAVAMTEHRPGTDQARLVVVVCDLPGAPELWARLAHTVDHTARSQVLTALADDITTLGPDHDPDAAPEPFGAGHAPTVDQQSAAVLYALAHIHAQLATRPLAGLPALPGPHRGRPSIHCTEGTLR